MKGFERENLLFSLCGLNCGLCVMRLGNYCPGCGGGEGNQSCKIARCSMEHGNPMYCFQCEAYPCERYAGEDAWDGFISSRNRKRDLEKARSIGLDAYNAEQREKVEILRFLLARCNDGRRKSLFSLAVNLLDLEELCRVLRSIREKIEEEDASLRESAAFAAEQLQAAAKKRGIELKLRRKK